MSLEPMLKEAFVPRKLEISVVVPVYNEVDSILELAQRVVAALNQAGYERYELLFVDDGSVDASWKEIERAHAKFLSSVRGVRHRRNFGKAAALASGFAAARGEIIITMDADLQDQPEEIPKLIQVLQEQDADLVSGWKRTRQDPIDKVFPSRIFNALTRWTSGLKLHDFNCGFKAYRADCAKHIRVYGELHRFIPVLAHAEGFRVVEVPVEHAARAHGKSKYGSTRMVKGFLDLLSVFILTRYLRRPGHFFGGLGLLSGIGGTGILAYLSAMKLFWGMGGIGTRPLFFLGILLVLLGVQLFSIGILGELVIKTTSRPMHSAMIRQRIG